ncbi:MAG: hypothetical protein IPK82_14335 [Polyangiaceae bacterium]|nr:hypothetical protein [Polyangiaceae bacterium]
MMGPQRALSTAAAITAFAWGLFVPALAQACPVCAQGESGGTGRKIALGLFIFLPFVVVGTILFILRGALRREQKMFVTRSEV